LTITENGTTDDIVVMESSDERLNAGAVEAAEKSLFKPRPANGHPVAVTGVIRRFRIQINDIKGEDRRNVNP
jgi:outer membrane biosynthesis protein TonB